MVFIYVGGMLEKCELVVGEIIYVDIGCFVVMLLFIDYDIQCVGGIKLMIFVGEGFFFVIFMGFGIVWIQSLLFFWFVGRMMVVVFFLGQLKGEGLILGGFGDLLDGDG